MILVNHQQLEEPYVQHLGNAPVELNQFGPIEIPTGQLFVAGDNRDVSRDSRLRNSVWSPRKVLMVKVCTSCARSGKGSEPIFAEVAIAPLRR